jgi:hypothetical protein
MELIQKQQLKQRLAVAWELVLCPSLCVQAAHGASRTQSPWEPENIVCSDTGESEWLAMNGKQPTLEAMLLLLWQGSKGGCGEHKATTQVSVSDDANPARVQTGGDAGGGHCMERGLPGAVGRIWW